MRHTATRSGTVCFIFAAICATSAGAHAAGDLPQIAVPPPPLGWSSWNGLGNDISQEAIEQQADALKRLNGSISDAALKYRYVNIDGGWWLSSYGDRTAAGGFAINPDLWDNGSLADTVAHIHKDGLLAGAYTDAGKTGCGGQNGSEGYYIPDMLQFAEWGFDYVKVDYCGGRAENLDPLETYTDIAQAITYATAETGRKFVFSVCNPGQVYGTAGYPDTGEGPWSWAPGVGDLPRVIWRSSDDITGGGGLSPFGTFQQSLDNFHSAYHPQAEHTGYYNDPDMMVTGRPGVDADPANPLQSQASMSLWAMSGAPMIKGANLVTTEATNGAVVGVMTNGNVLKLDQDARGVQGIEIAVPEPGVEVWGRLLSGSGRRALMVLNETNATISVTLPASDLGKLGLNPADGVTLTDLWSNAAVTPDAGSSAVTLAVPARSARLLSVSGTDLAATNFEPTASNGAGRNSFQIATTAVANDAGTFQTQQGINALDIAYRNPGRSTRYASLAIAGQPATTVAFPPTAASGGTVTVAANLTTQSDNFLNFTPPPGATPGPAPVLQPVSLVAGPVPVFVPMFEADAPGNALSGMAVVQTCATCGDGKDVGEIGTSNGQSGSLTFNNVTVASSGAYTLLISYQSTDSAPQRTADISVNGAAPTTVSFPSAGKDYDTEGVIPVPVTLQAGNNTVAFSNPTGFAPNFVALDVTTP